MSNMSTAAETPNQPNILFIMTDQQHAQCLGIAGHPQIQTPHLDALAAKGAWFRQMYSCTAICLPSRTSFLTGTYLRTHEMYVNAGEMRRDLPTMLTELKQAGYRTGMAGKNHTPEAISREFDWMASMSDYKSEMEELGLAEEHGEDWHQKFMSSTYQLPDEHHRGIWTGAQTVRYLEETRDDERPFFFWSTFAPPHAPHTPPRRYEEMYNPDDVEIDWEAYERFERSRVGQRAMIEDFWKVGSVRHEPEVFQQAVCRYLALITMVDDQVGRILAKLEELGLADNTIVVFTSDHGDFAGHWGQLGKNVPGYDDLLRIPFIYYDPTRCDAGRCVESLHQSIDLFPTLLERVGAEVPPTVQGRSLLPALDGYQNCGRDAVFAETDNVKTCRTVDWKLNFFADHPDQGQLFRMGACPDETTNLWDDPAHAHIKQRLLLRLLQWTAECEQPAGMCGLSTTPPDTRWYRWLSQRPNQCVKGSKGENV